MNLNGPDDDDEDEEEVFTTMKIKPKNKKKKDVRDPALKHLRSLPELAECGKVLARSPLMFNPFGSEKP